MSPDAYVARVRDGRLVLDVASDLPEGAEVQLVRSREGPGCNVLLFVTTASEREALSAVATRMGIQIATVSGRFSDYLDLGQLSPQYRVFAVETEMGALQAGGSATKALLCPIETGARDIVAVGMAFGVDRVAQHLGDVLVASHVLPYDFVLVDTEKDGRLPRVVYNNVKVNATRSPLRRVLERHIALTPPAFNVHVGAMLSGSAQIQCRAYRDHLVAKLGKKLADLDHQRQSREEGCTERVRIVGGEMEGLGLIATSEASWLIVKGISDFADEEHGADATANRQSACMNAIELVLEALVHAPLPERQDRNEVVTL